MRDSDHSSDSEAATIPRETHNTEQVYESEYKTARFDNIYQVEILRNEFINLHLMDREWLNLRK